MELQTPDGVDGEVTLVGGVAVPGDEKTRLFLDDLNVVEPGTFLRLDYAAGARYLKALPWNLAGTRLWAVLRDG